MIEVFLNRLSTELSLPPCTKGKEKKTFSFQLNEEITLQVKDLDPGVSMKSPLILCPKQQREELFILLMKANLLGQATGNSRIGIDLDEKTLTLSLGLPYELSYQAFRETVEDFVNYLIYWREEITKFDNRRTGS